MNISKTMLLLGTVLLIGAGCVTTQPATTDTNSAAGTQPAGTPYVDDTPTAGLPTNPNPIEDTEEPNTIAVGEPNPATPTSVIALTNGGTYGPYDENKLANAENGDVVLFFHASWCPSCRALDSDINDNLENIPSNLTILNLDYDTESTLKKKYGVRSQHTLVQVDANGDLIQIWRGGNRLSDLVSSVQ